MPRGEGAASVARRSTSLSARILLAIVSVNLVAVIVTALIAFPVVQRSAETQARRQLTAQARELARTRDTADPASSPDSGTAGDRFAIVASDGTVTGGARDEVDADTAAQLRAGRSVSTTTTLSGREAVLVGIPTADGGGVVGVRRVADITAANADVVRWLIIALSVGLFAATVAGVLLARRLGRPLRRVAASARELAAGHRGVIMTPESITEIADIAHALGGLDTALTVSERRQRDFLLSVSHDIRTPLTALRGYAEALADGLIPADDVPAVGATLSAESERLRRFLDDLLQLARLEADEFALDPQVIDARETVRSAVDAWRAAAARAGVMLRADVPTVPLAIETDPMRLRQVIDGLIENALRVTAEGAPVIVTAAAAGRGIRVSVRDGGPGLTSEDVAVAFERGALHARYRDIRAVGTGLGLSIAHRLVTRLGGSIDVGAAPEGGAAFAVSLPTSNIPRAAR